MTEHHQMNARGTSRKKRGKCDTVQKNNNDESRVSLRTVQVLKKRQSVGALDEELKTDRRHKKIFDSRHKRLRN